MADFLYNAGPPPSRSQFGGRPTPPPSQPGSRYLPPSQARGPPSSSTYAQPHTDYDQLSQLRQYTHRQPPYSPTSFQSPPHRSPDLGEIKCSSCGAGVRLEDLGEHVCHPTARTGRHQEENGRNLNDLKVDVRAAGPRGYEAPNSARTPMFAGHLEATPHKPGSISSPLQRPHSPGADQLSRSVGSTTSASSSSSSRLPFFERYQKQYGGAGSSSNGANMAGIGARPGFPRSETMHNMSAALARDGSPSPRFAAAGQPGPPTRSTTSPLPNSSSAPNLHVPHSQRQDSLPPPLNQQRQRQATPTPSQGSYRSDLHGSYFPSYPHERMQDTPDSSILSSSPPRSRKISLRGDCDASGPSSNPPHSGPLPHASNRTPSQSSSASSTYLAYDRRHTMKPSQSTPADLSSYASSSSTLNGVKRKDSASELDACLEDLRILTEGEASEGDDAGGAQAMLDEFFVGESRESFPDDGPRGRDAQDPLATPRAGTSGSASSSRLPSSRSTPALGTGVPAASATSPPSFANNLPTSGSVPNLSGRARPAASSAPPSNSCTTCSIPLSPSAVQLSGDGQPFCRPCYSARFLPKCRKCGLPIEGGAVTSSDGKVTGKYHRGCFACFECGEGFAGGEFYVFDGKPYCQLHYHALNGSLCANLECGQPIEGPCVSLVGEENGGGGRYHPAHFLCSDPTCRVPLLHHHYVVDQLPYCEMHSAGPVRRRKPRVGAGGETGEERAMKRMTVIGRV
ncbi:hypothetical protein JCM11251_003973 [Rhodosporidiobolus azoricus]